MICQRNYKTPENTPKNGVHFLQRLEIQMPMEEPSLGLSRCSLLNY